MQTRSLPKTAPYYFICQDSMDFTVGKRLGGYPCDVSTELLDGNLGWQDDTV
ncbi:UNVERIFIED_CONTAM: hypothetical protein FKN15_028896 [Acipenser sinensis]